MSINFKLRRSERALIEAICARGMEMAKEAKRYDISSTDMAMDITACHLNGCPLKLEKLLNADDFNFAHDVFGINRHIDRDTGKLSNHFLPRFRDEC